MGNCCGSQKQDNFSSPGRTLGATPAPNPESTPPRASIPPGVKAQAQGVNQAGDRTAAGSAAAKAAEARAAAASSPKGKLGNALANQKKMTHAGTLEAASADERNVRQQDANVETLQHN